MRAEALLAQAETLFRQSLGDKHPFVWETHANLADQIGAQGRLQEAETMYRVGVEQPRRDLGTRFAQGRRHPRAPRIEPAPAGSPRRSRAPAAPPGYEAIRKAVGEKSVSTATAASRLAETLAAKQDADSRREARTLFDAAVAIFRGPPVNPRLGEVLLASGRMALAQGDRERGTRELEEAQRLTSGLWGREDRRAREAREMLARAN